MKTLRFKIAIIALVTLAFTACAEKKTTKNSNGGSKKEETKNPNSKTPPHIESKTKKTDQEKINEAVNRLSKAPAHERNEALQNFLHILTHLSKHPNTLKVDSVMGMPAASL